MKTNKQKTKKPQTYEQKIKLIKNKNSQWDEKFYFLRNSTRKPLAKLTKRLREMVQIN